MRIRWYVWDYNGPALVTRIMKKWCNVEHIGLMTPERCRGLQVLQPKSFFPVNVQTSIKFFESHHQSVADEGGNENFELDESVVGAHVWNKLTADLVVNKKSDQLYVHLARSSCPLIFEVAPNEF